MSAPLHFVPFRTAHLRALPMPAAAGWADAAARHPAIAADYEQPDLAWTAFRDRAPVAAGGIRPDLAECGHGLQGECWTLFGPGLCVADWRRVLVKMRQVLAAAEAAGYRRLHAYVRTDLPFGVKLAQAMGFRIEALLERWGPADADTLMVARVKPRGGAFADGDPRVKPEDDGLRRVA